MKKIISLSVILLLVCQSCHYFDIEPTVIQKFSNEDLAVVPYQKGQQFNMIDQNNDTILWIVNTDTISKERDSYKRHIEINSIDNNQIIFLDLKVNKQLDICYYIAKNKTAYSHYFDFNAYSPRTLVIDNDTLYNVYISSNDLNNYSLYYTFNQGIIRMQNDTTYLQLIQ
ncbi:MAG: hypothetical protein J5701_06085 [Bacteroidales bacterium]|nr:hypothetical protein [Bacteroidales bacterium]